MNIFDYLLLIHFGGHAARMLFGVGRQDTAAKGWAYGSAFVVMLIYLYGYWAGWGNA